MNVWAAALPLLFATFAAAGDWDLSKQNARDWAVLTFQDDAGRNYGDGQLTKDTKELYFFRVKDADPKQPAEHLPIYKASLEGMRAKLREDGPQRLVIFEKTARTPFFVKNYIGGLDGVKVGVEGNEALVSIQNRLTGATSRAKRPTHQVPNALRMED